MPATNPASGFPGGCCLFRAFDLRGGGSVLGIRDFILLRAATLVLVLLLLAEMTRHRAQSCLWIVSTNPNFFRVSPHTSELAWKKHV